MDNELDVAIVGMACRFPGARTLDEFWRNLAAGAESIARFTDDELAASGVDPACFGRPDYVKAAPVLEEFDRFDAGFFGFSPAEAATLDPQHRFLLELAHTALEDAGCAPSRFPGRIGVFAGAAMNTYFTDRGLGRRWADDYIPVLTANDKDFLATRISYKLGLRGPSLTVQTACSTSLVAIHLARQSLLSEESDLALAGAVSVRVPHRAGYLYDGSGVVSPDGHVRAFDAAANGTVFGSGAGVVVLKRLADAVAQGDRIYAVIKGSAVNNDGALKGGYTAPSVDGQADAAAEALADAGLSAEDLSYLEAHGSGTPVGDRIELAALTNAFRQFTERTGYCALGSVKTNVGHLDVAAGMAGLIKTALALERGFIPPSLHFERPNDPAAFAASPFFVNTVLRPWPKADRPRRAGVMATGMGGTNACIVLEEARPHQQPAPAAAPSPELWVMSAKTESALSATAANLRRFLESQQPPPAAAAIAGTLQRGREAFRFRRIVVCSDTAQGIAALASDAGSGSETGEVSPEGTPPVVFLLAGVGDHYVGMGAGLYERFPAFRAEVDRCAEILRPMIGRDIREFLRRRGERPPGATDPLRRMLGFSDGHPSDPLAAELNRTLWAQPALFTIEYALARLWMSWGVAPAALVGHSLGEYVAACLAGVFSLPDALRLIAARARLVNELPEGAMLAVMLPEAELLPRLGPEVSIALVNGRQLCVVAGPAAAIAELNARLTAEDIVVRPVRNGHAFHSRMLDPIVARLAEEVSRVERREPALRFISGVSGDWITPAQATDPNYWAEHARTTVRFADALERAWSIPEAMLLEVGPGRTLGVLAAQHPGRRSSGKPPILSSLSHECEPHPDSEVMLKSAGRLWLRGVELNWDEIAPTAGRSKIALPTYPFERARHWAEGAGDASAPKPRPGLADWIYEPWWERTSFRRAARPQKEGARPLWLIIGEPSSLARRFAQSLEETAGQAVSAWPSDEAGWNALIRSLRDRIAGGLNILYLGCLAAAREHDGVAPERTARDLGFNRLILLAQVLGECRLGIPVRIGVVTNRVHEVVGDERLDPAMAVVAGICQVVHQEYPTVTAFSVDLPGIQPADPREPQWCRGILSEFDRTEGDLTIAYRGRFRWVRRFRSHALGPVEREAGEAGLRALGLRWRGVYLLAGGAGGLGLEIAKYLARTCQARLILTRKSAFPERGAWHLDNPALTEADRKIVAALLEVQALGGEVDVFACDVTDRAGMEQVAAHALRRYGAVHGVMHLAGVLHDGVMALKTVEVVDSVLRPKAEGTRVLYELCRRLQPDLFVLFSSLASVAPFHGQSDYCAANAFLDAFGAFANAEGSVRTLTINWPIWRDVGIFTRLATPAGLERRHEEVLQSTIDTKEGLDIFERALASGLPQVIVTPVPLETMIARSRRPLEQETSAAAPAEPPEAAPPPADSEGLQAEVEQSLTAIWSHVLGISPIGPHDNFLDLGGHSLLAAQIVAQIRKRYRIGFTLRNFFDAPTIAEAAVVIQEAVLAEIESLAER